MRGAIDLAAVTVELARLNGPADRERLILDAALLALSARIGVDEGAGDRPAVVGPAPAP
ncbi:MAG TPA: hypothetical protein VJ870_19175 [Amycolatopsis sp.]|nr:hypothetical protein [Amycolatopsis sp.]